MARSYKTRERPNVKVGEVFMAPCKFDVERPLSWRDSEGRCMGCGQKFVDGTGHALVRTNLVSVDITDGVFAEWFRVTVEDIK